MCKVHDEEIQLSSVFADDQLVTDWLEMLTLDILPH